MSRELPQRKRTSRKARARKVTGKLPEHLLHPYQPPESMEFTVGSIPRNLTFGEILAGGQPPNWGDRVVLSSRPPAPPPTPTPQPQKPATLRAKVRALVGRVRAWLKGRL